MDADTQGEVLHQPRLCHQVFAVRCDVCPLVDSALCQLPFYERRRRLDHTFLLWIILFGWIVIVGYMFFTGDSVQLPRQPIEWGCIVLLALMPTLLSLYFLNISIQSIGSTLSSILGALEPVTAVVISTFVFGEPFTVRLAIGIVLILSAVLLIIGGNGMLKKLLHKNV